MTSARAARGARNRPVMPGWRATARAGVLCSALAVAACDGYGPHAIEAGQALYRESGCAGCHGGTGHGDGPVGATLDVRPRDFRDAAAFIGGTDVDAIAETIARGMRRSRPSSPGHDQLMPNFAHLTKAERRALAAYVVSLRADAATPAGAGPRD